MITFLLFLNTLQIILFCEENMKIFPCAFAMPSDFVWNFVKTFFNMYVFVPITVFFRIAHKVFDFIEILRCTSNIACSCLAGGRELEAGSHSVARVGLELARSAGTTSKQSFFCLCPPVCSDINPQLLFFSVSFLSFENILFHNYKFLKFNLIFLSFRKALAQTFFLCHLIYI